MGGRRIVSVAGSSGGGSYGRRRRRRSPRGDAVKRQTGPPPRAAAARLLCMPSVGRAHRAAAGGVVEPAGRFAISTSPVRRKRTGRHRRAPLRSSRLSLPRASEYIYVIKYYYFYIIYYNSERPLTPLTRYTRHVHGKKIHTRAREHYYDSIDIGKTF